MSEKTEDKIRLEHILIAISKIQARLENVDETRFLNDFVLSDSCALQLAVVGEAASKLSPSIRNKYLKIAWRQIIGMRNIIIHEYFGVSLHSIWTTVQNDVPQLKNQIEAILKELE